MACLPPPEAPQLLPPPIYTPSCDAPSYSVEPGPQEQRLALAACRHGRRHTPNGTCTHKSSGIIVALRNQEQGTSYPTYGRGALIAGDIGLKSTQGVMSVTVKVEGRLSLTITEGMSTVIPFLNSTNSVWKADEGSASACPSMFPFEMSLPLAYQDGDRSRPLPPTYNAAYRGIPDLYINCNYTLSVRVVKARNLKLWKPQKTLNIQLMYRPRTRPHQPILRSPFPFYSTIKSLPEEWHQVVSTMPSLPGCVLSPIECHLFVPAVQIYSITDSIPFYLRLHAPPDSLQAFIHSTRPRPSSSTRLGRSRSRTEPPATPTVRVYLSRQITAIVRGQRVQRSCDIGEGTLCALSPESPALANVLRAPEDGCSTLEWEGHVKCRGDVAVGGFNTGKLVVRDFITVNLAPPNPTLSPLAEHVHSHGIRLVTDSFLDVAEPGREELFFSS